MTMMKGGRTWRFDSGGLVMWNFRPMARSDGGLVPLELEDQEIRRRWLCDLVGRLPALLGDFGCPTEVCAHAVGKRRCVIDWRNEEGPSALLAFLRQGAALVVEFELDLTCLGMDLEPMKVPCGAEFLVHIKLMDGDSGALNPETDTPIHIRLKLNADIYAPRSLGEIQNNVFLAALNGPRLAGVLERIERDVPAELLEIDEYIHPRRTVGPRGFKADKDDRSNVV
jgi:hypothetical protein